MNATLLSRRLERLGRLMADAEGRVWIGLNVAIIRLGDATIVVDPGLDDPDSAWQRERPRVWPNWAVRARKLRSNPGARSMTMKKRSPDSGPKRLWSINCGMRRR